MKTIGFLRVIADLVKATSLLVVVLSISILLIPFAVAQDLLELVTK
jgi:hypothetical protein